MEAKYKVGDVLTFINSYGVNFGEVTITGVAFDRGYPSYFYEPTDTPWFSTAETNLYVPGTEPVFKLELNNGLTVDFIESDNNGNKIYDVYGEKAILIDGKLHDILDPDGFAEAGMPLKEDYQPKQKEAQKLFSADIEIKDDIPITRKM